jgi:hypothetical protein
MKPEPFNLEDAAKKAGIKQQQSTELKAIVNRLRSLDVIRSPKQEPMADSLNEKPTLISILDDYALQALDTLPNAHLVESIVMVRTSDVHGLYAYSVQAKLRQFSLDGAVANERLVDALIEFRGALERVIQELKENK